MFGGMTNLKQRRRKWKTSRRRRARQWSIAAASPGAAATAPAHERPADPVAECSAVEKVVTQLAPVTRVSIFSNLLLAVSSLYWGWRSQLIKVCSRLWGALFPSRVCLQEINALQQRVEELQVEMARLRSALQLSGAVNIVCSCQAPDARGWAISPLQLPPPHTPSVKGHGMQLPALAALPPAPPPPPPPPPPVLPAPKPLQILKKSGSTTSRQSLAVKQVGPAAVTLRDLLNVKLRKANAALHKPQVEEDCPGSDPRAETSLQKPLWHSKGKELTCAISPEKTRAPLITMSDLRRVSLRTSHTDLPPKLKIGLHRTPSKSPLNLRKHLKKVNIDRSPGGTPLYEKENRETGTGLTPIMTQALRRKFQMAHPKSPSPSNRAVNRSFDDANN
ncbi:proline-rich protein 11 isoform X2 [Polyodon spathula]|uniref:proline-rich protein 11 isoform X2 n=1 Tax=Polyodon spathula TaxID=7913 RepID=UPI001B7EBC13|nr:proline-rich protein 11 isoform X2 [Polyodon spathula]